MLKEGVFTQKEISPKRVSGDRLTFNMTAAVKCTHQTCYKILNSGSLNLPFQKHEEDLWVCRDIFYGWCTSANLPSHNVAEQMNHILLPLKKKAVRQLND